MALDLSETLVVGISATALFDMSESDKMFKAALEADPESVIDNYRRYMQAREGEPLAPGTGYHLVKALLDLNQHMKGEDISPLVEVVVMSRNSPDTGIRVLKTIRNEQLAITRSAFTGGESVADYIDAFDVDLFLTTNVEDAQRVIDSRRCAAAILKLRQPMPRKFPRARCELPSTVTRCCSPMRASWFTRRRDWTPFRHRRMPYSTRPWRKGLMQACSKS